MEEFLRMYLRDVYAPGHLQALPNAPTMTPTACV